MRQLERSIALLERATIGHDESDWECWACEALRNLRDLRAALDDGESVLPMRLDDGSSIICDSVAGGANSTDGIPNELHLRVRDADGTARRARYVLATTTRDRDLGEVLLEQQRREEIAAGVRPAVMDAPGGPVCACGRPSAYESGACVSCAKR